MLCSTTIKPLLIAALAACVKQILAAPAPANVQLPLSHKQPGLSSNRDPFTPQFDAYIKDLLDEWNVAGLAIGIVDSHASHVKAYGMAQLPDVPATTDTLWYVGSTTKAQVAAALAQILDDKTYPVLARGWQTPISSIIRDDFVVGDEWATAHLTLEDAVSHRTGVAANFDAYPNIINGTLATSGEMTRLLRYFPLTWEPRTKWEYNNWMYTMLSHVIETVTGEPLRHTLGRILWEPLGMSSTFLNLKDLNTSDYQVARGYYWDREQHKFGEYPLWDAPGVSGAGTELSTVGDYTKWLSCLIHETLPLSKASHADIRTPRMIEKGFPSQGFDVSLYGLAWFRTTLHGHAVYQHTGSIESHGSNVIWLPELDYGIVIFVNQPNEIRHVIARKLMEDRIGTPEADRFDISGFWKKTLADMDHQIDHAVDLLFPNRPNPGHPSTHTQDALVGTYHHPGYGTLDIRLDVNPQKPSGKILVADRKELAFPVQWRLEHVSGDDWMVWRYSYVNTARPSGAYAVRVETAVNGGVKSIKMKMPEEVVGKAPLWIVFSRTD